MLLYMQLFIKLGVLSGMTNSVDPDQTAPQMKICMKCQILFSRKNKKNINLSSAGFAHSMVSDNV